MSKIHDRGGWPSEEMIDRSDHIWTDWEYQTHALVGALRDRVLMNTDELRRGIEAIPAEDYERHSYYERWSSSLETILTEKGVLTTDGIDAKVKELEGRWESEN